MEQVRRGRIERVETGPGPDGKGNLLQVHYHDSMVAFTVRDFDSSNRRPQVGDEVEVHVQPRRILRFMNVPLVREIRLAGQAIWQRATNLGEASNG